jgi:hypothetical protein
MESKTDYNSQMSQQQSASTSASAQQQASRLLSVQVTDENTALNVIVGFLELAQRRGVYSFDESAKILECIKKFQKNT